MKYAELLAGDIYWFKSSLYSNSNFDFVLQKPRINVYGELCWTTLHQSEKHKKYVIRKPFCADYSTKITDSIGVMRKA